MLASFFRPVFLLLLCFGCCLHPWFPLTVAAEDESPLLRLGIKELRTQGGLPAPALEPLIQQLLPQLLGCVSRGLPPTPLLPEQITLRFNISPQGRINWLKFLDGGPRPYEACLKEILLGQAWPPAPQTTKALLILGLKTDHLLSP